MMDSPRNPNMILSPEAISVYFQTKGQNALNRRTAEVILLLQQRHVTFEKRETRSLMYKKPEAHMIFNPRQDKKGTYANKTSDFREVNSGKCVRNSTSVIRAKATT